jgi:hypothetical protein
VTIPENVYANHSMIRTTEKCRLKNSRDLGGNVSRERIGYIFHEIVDRTKLSVKWVPKCRNAVEKRFRVPASEAIFYRVWWGPVRFLNRLVTMDGSRIHISISSRD